MREFYEGQIREHETQRQDQLISDVKEKHETERKVEINNIFAEIKNQAHLNKLTEITT